MSGGGGGYGDPLTRDARLVARDVAAGLVSVTRARKVYGVVLQEGAVDVAATTRLRVNLAADKAPTASYDFGPARSEWERVHGLAAGLIADWLPGIPAGTRRYAQAQVYRRLHATGRGPYRAPEVESILTDVAAELGAVWREEAAG